MANKEAAANTSPVPQEGYVTGNELLATVADLRTVPARSLALQRQCHAARMEVDKLTNPSNDGLFTMSLRSRIAAMRYGMKYRQASAFQAQLDQRRDDTNHALTTFFKNTPHTITLTCPPEGSSTILDYDRGVTGNVHISKVTGRVEEVALQRTRALLIVDAEGQQYEAHIDMEGGSTPDISINYEEAH